jgi:hypothetical protein
LPFVAEGMAVNVLHPLHTTKRPSFASVKLGGLYILMGKNMVEVPRVKAGAICGVVGICMFFWFWHFSFFVVLFVYVLFLVFLLFLCVVSFSSIFSAAHF